MVVSVPAAADRGRCAACGAETVTGSGGMPRALALALRVVAAVAVVAVAVVVLYGSGAGASPCLCAISAACARLASSVEHKERESVCNGDMCA